MAEPKKKRKEQLNVGNVRYVEILEIITKVW